jgi:hypothetical protein
MLKTIPFYRAVMLVFLLSLALTACGGSADTGHITYTGTASLQWQSSTTYLDGSPLTPAGYRIYYGTSSRSYARIIDIPISHFSNTNAPKYVVTALAPGTHYFAVSVYDASRVEGALSAEASKVIP